MNKVRVIIAGREKYIIIRDQTINVKGGTIRLIDTPRKEEIDEYFLSKLILLDKQLLKLTRQLSPDDE